MVLFVIVDSENPQPSQETDEYRPSNKKLVENLPQSSRSLRRHKEEMWKKLEKSMLNFLKPHKTLQKPIERICRVIVEQRTMVGKHTVREMAKKENLNNRDTETVVDKVYQKFRSALQLATK